jgi:hypothetical protein
MKGDFKNDATQAERQEALRNDTYHGRASHDLELGGRFAAINKPSIIGAASAKYPKLPSSSPWSADPVPPEEPLGFEINALEPVGTAAEIEASLGEAAAPADVHHPPSVVETASPNPTAQAKLFEILPCMIRRKLP